MKIEKKQLLANALNVEAQARSLARRGKLYDDLMRRAQELRKAAQC